MPGRSTLFTRTLRQKAVYWGGQTNDGYGGRTFDLGIEIKCRWSQRQELFIDKNGQESMSLAVVHPDRDLELGDWIALGAIADLTAGQIADPLLVAMAYEIRSFKKVPNMGASHFARTIWLGRSGFGSVA